MVLSRSLISISPFFYKGTSRFLFNNRTVSSLGSAKCLSFHRYGSSQSSYWKLISTVKGVFVEERFELDELMQEKVNKADSYCSKCVDFAKDGLTFSSLAQLEKVRSSIADVASLIHAKGIPISTSKEAQSFFKEKISSYEESTSGAVQLLAKKCFIGEKNTLLRRKKEIDGCIEFFFDASHEPRHEVDFSELISEYRKPKDLEDAKFLFELALNEYSHYKNFPEAIKAFKILMIEFYHTKRECANKGRDILFQQEIEGYRLQFMRMLELASKKAMLHDLNYLKLKYFDNTLRLNKLWREIQMHSQVKPVEDLTTFKLIKSGAWEPEEISAQKKKAMLLSSETVVSQ